MGEEFLLLVLSADLTSKQADAFIDRVVLGRPIKEIAFEYGVSRAAIAALVDKACRRMRRVLAAAA